MKKNRAEHPDSIQAVTHTNPVQKHQRRMCRIAVNRFLSDAVFRDHPPTTAARLTLRTRDVFVASCRDVSQSHPGLLEGITRTSRDHFIQSEVDRLLNLTELSVRDRLILRIMFRADSSVTDVDSDFGGDRVTETSSIVVDTYWYI